MLRRLLRRVRFTDWRGSLDGRVTFWSRTILDAYGWRIALHHMIAPDDPGCFHTHPAWAVRVVLSGGYVEELEGGVRLDWRPGRFGIVRPSLSHRIAGLLARGGSYSLWIRAPKSASIELRGAGWPVAPGEHS